MTTSVPQTSDIDIYIVFSIIKIHEQLTFYVGSRKDYLAFPTPIIRRAGFQLDRVQRGLDPDDWKPMASIGSGVKEVRLRDDTGAYRVIYVATFAESVFVLHAFQKKTQRTAKRDIDLATLRFKELARSLKS